MPRELIKITRESGIPLIGAIPFGIIDRGTSLLQIRPTSICNLNCPFCSVDSGIYSKRHQADYEVEVDYLVDWTKEIVEFKIDNGCEKVELNLDSVGEIASYQKLSELVSKLKAIKGVYFVSMQTNGCLLTEKRIDELEKAGLGRLNLSIHTLDKERAKYLAGVPNYSIEHIINLARHIAKSKIELMITPVWIPKINDEDIVEIIKFAKEINARLGIQKYETYRYSRKIKEGKEMNYWKFYNQLSLWEKEFNIKLKLTAKDMSIVKCKRIPEDFKVGDKFQAKIVCPGWIEGQMIASAKNRCISVNNCNIKVGNLVRLKIVETKNSIYVADC
jgi:uncharacterized Fe-S cluster-containing radical SAM superfamily enzyme